MGVPITSRSNPAFQHLRRLATDARERVQAGRTLIEGDHLIGSWLGHGLPVVSCAVDAAALELPAIAAAIARLRLGGIEPLVLASALMRQVSALDSPAKLIAEIEPCAGDLGQARGEDAVVLDAVQDPGNVGAILRTCAAAGIRHVIAGPGSAALWSPKVIRAAMGAHAVLNLISVDTGGRGGVEGLPAVIAGLGVPALGTSPHARASLHDTALAQPCAWVFGHEGHGLSAPVESALTRRLAITQAPGVESLNVAAAVAVCLFEQRRQRRAAAAPPGATTPDAATLTGAGSGSR